MNSETLAKYLHAFSNLGRHIVIEYGQAPHKSVLLLALLDEIERGTYKNNLITITPELIGGFRSYWAALVTSDYWKPTMHNPFRHLYQEGWWYFVKNGVVIAPVHQTPSLKFMSEEYDGIRLAPDLWQLLQDRVALNCLRNHLLQTYFGKNDMSEINRKTLDDVLNFEAEQLKLEAKRPFVSRVRERKEETYFLRHTLFPKVIRSIYHDECAVCRLGTRYDESGTSTILDGAHIIPFSESHNDDPRNGIAFCKNHHWGFDRGWFTISDEYHVHVSPHLANGTGYVTEGVRIRLPGTETLYPAPDALEWHRVNVFKK